MDRWFQYGSDLVIVRSGMPEESVRIGIGSTRGEAIDSLEITPIQSAGPDSGHTSALRWAQNQGWFSVSGLRPLGHRGNPGESVLSAGASEDFPWAPLLAAVAAGFGIVMIGSYAFGAKRTTASGAAYDPRFSGRPTTAQCLAAKAADPRFTGAVAAAGDRCTCIGDLRSPGGTQPCAAPGTAPPTASGYDPTFGGRPTAAQCQAAHLEESLFTGAVAATGDRCACITNYRSPGGTRPCACPPNTGEFGVGNDRKCCPDGQRADSTNTRCVARTGPAVMQDVHEVAHSGAGFGDDALDLLLR